MEDDLLSEAEALLDDAPGRLPAPVEVESAANLELPLVASAEDAAAIAATPTAPSAPVGSNDTPSLFPPTFNDWPVKPDGSGLYVPSLEDSTSPEAQALIEQYGREEYNRLVAEYNSDRALFQMDRMSTEASLATAATANLTASIPAAQKAVADLFVPSLGDGAQTVVASFVPLAQQTISDYQERRSQELTAAGYPASRARHLAALEIAQTPDVFQLALASSIADDLPKFAQALNAALTGGAAPQTNNAQRQAPPAMAPSGGGGAIAVAAPRRLTAAEAEIGRDLGYTPQQYAERLARRESNR
jgi:hypothetical protein